MGSGDGKTVLVTGGAGFIGHHLVKALVGRGHRVRVLDDLSSGKLTRLEDVKGKVEFIQGDVRDATAVAKAVAGADLVYHEAAWVSVPQSVTNPVGYMDVNEAGTLRLLEAARSAGVKRVVYAASSAAYGDQPELPKRESQKPDPISPYAVSKFVGELYLNVYAKLYGMETVSLRYFNVFGPQQDPKSQYGAAIPMILSRMIKGEQPIIFGDGEQTRDFCYIDNVVHANLLAGEAKGVAGQVVNIACGRRTSLNEIVAMANKVLGTNIEPKYEAPRAGDVRDSLADISLAKQVIGYEPVVQFEEGLARSIEYYRKLAVG